MDAIRHIFLGTLPGLGVTVVRHTTTVVEEVAVVGLLGVVCLGAAVLAFSRRE